MKWQETTLRKGTKSPKVCRDQFITDSRGKFRLCKVGNGRMVSKEIISAADAEKLIETNRLVGSSCCFKGCFTFRTYKSTKLVNKLLEES